MNVTLTLSVDAINLILSALAELPYKVSAPLLEAIQNEAREQTKEKEAPAEESPDKTK